MGQRRLEHSAVKTSRQSTLAPLPVREKKKEISKGKPKREQAELIPKQKTKKEVRLKEAIPKPKEKPRARAKAKAKIKYRKPDPQKKLIKTRQQKKLTYNIV